MSYSKKYRERIIEYRQDGHTLEQTHEISKVSMTIQKWEKQLKGTGDLGKKDLHRGFRKIDPEKLKTYVAEHPDAYQLEKAQAFGCSESGIRDALKQHKIMRKKTTRYQEQDQQEVEAYKNRTKIYYRKNITYVYGCS